MRAGGLSRSWSTWLRLYKAQFTPATWTRLSNFRRVGQFEMSWRDRVRGKLDSSGQWNRNKDQLHLASEYWPRACHRPASVPLAVELGRCWKWGSIENTGAITYAKPSKQKTLGVSARTKRSQMVFERWSRTAIWCTFIASHHNCFAEILYFYLIAMCCFCAICRPTYTKLTAVCCKCTYMYMLFFHASVWTAILCWKLLDKHECS